MHCAYAWRVCNAIKLAFDLQTARVGGENVLSCFDVSPDVKDELKLRYTSMRVCVYSMDIKKLYDGNLWPMGVVVRPWKFKHRS